jgi:hypothetical protein
VPVGGGHPPGGVGECPADDRLLEHGHGPNREECVEVGGGADPEPGQERLVEPGKVDGEVEVGVLAGTRVAVAVADVELADVEQGLGVALRHHAVLAGSVGAGGHCEGLGDHGGSRGVELTGHGGAVLGPERRQTDVRDRRHRAVRVDDVGRIGGAHRLGLHDPVVDRRGGVVDAQPDEEGRDLGVVGGVEADQLLGDLAAHDLDLRDGQSTLEEQSGEGGPLGEAAGLCGPADRFGPGHRDVGAQPADRRAPSVGVVTTRADELDEALHDLRLQVVERPEPLDQLVRCGCNHRGRDGAADICDGGDRTAEHVFSLLEHTRERQREESSFS